MQGKDEKADQETLLQGLWAPATGSAQLFSLLNLHPFRHSPGRWAGPAQGGLAGRTGVCLNSLGEWSPASCGASSKSADCSSQQSPGQDHQDCHWDGLCHDLLFPLPTPPPATPSQWRTSIWVIRSGPSKDVHSECPWGLVE